MFESWRSGAGHAHGTTTATAAAEDRTSTSTSGAGGRSSTRSRTRAGGRYRGSRGVSRDNALYRYTSGAGSAVVVPSCFDPWRELGLAVGASRREVKAAYGARCSLCDRQTRALASLAYLAITTLCNTRPTGAAACKYITWATPAPTDGKPGRGERGSDGRVTISDNIFVAIACGNATRVAEYLATGKVNVDETDSLDHSLLYLAARCGFYDLTEMLLRRGAQVKHVQRDGSTPLHGASFYGHDLVVKLLLSYGVPTSAKNAFGNTAAEEARTKQIQRAIRSSGEDAVESLAARLVAAGLGQKVRLLRHDGKIVAKEILRDPSSMDAWTRAQWPSIQARWETAWHGTRLRHVESIMEHGLRASGSTVGGTKLAPPPGHYRLGETHFGIANWAAAIFLSPSLTYSGHACYADRVLSMQESGRKAQWAVIFKCRVKPGSYKSYDPTVYAHKPIDGEPSLPEYRVPGDSSSVMRVEHHRSVVVESALFVSLSFLETTIPGDKLTFDMVNAIIAGADADGEHK